MEQKFGKNSIDIEALREFCEREGKEVTYRKGEQFEREGDPARWFGFVTKGCFKYITRGISDERDHLTWFSFEGEFVADYPCVLSGQPSQATIEAMMSCRVWRVSNAMSCCCSVAPALLSILTYKTSPPSFASPQTI